MSELEIQDLRADDESLYKCELTYLEVRDDCSVIQFVNLTTMGKWKIRQRQSDVRNMLRTQRAKGNVGSLPQILPKVMASKSHYL